MTGLAARVGWLRAGFLAAAGGLLLGAAAVAPAPKPNVPVVWWTRPASQAEERRWQVDDLSALIDEARRRDGVAP